MSKQIQYDKNQNSIKTLISFHNTPYRTAYGNIDINGNKDKNMIFRWTLKMIKVNGHEICIGIDASNKRFIDNMTFQINTTKYHYYTVKYKWFYSHHGIMLSQLDITYGDPYIFKTDDIVTMELNTTKKSLNYYVNGNQHKSFGFNTIELKSEIIYNLAVILQDKGDCVQLLNFEQINIE